MSPYPFSNPEPNCSACEEDINRRIAIAKHVESKLELRGAQNEAWQKNRGGGHPFPREDV
jgi:hypothetical protein